jgi:tryptophanyl-tRNA synthetase
MTQFKEKANGQVGVPVGLYTYPVLMAADIAMYKATRVPVGEDQQQHLELAREILRRFNAHTGLTLPDPPAVLTQTPRIMSLADPSRKMCKSKGRGDYIELVDPPEVVRKKVMGAVTDPGPVGAAPSAGVTNLLLLLLATGNRDDHARFLRQHTEGSIRYGDLKGRVADALVEHLAPIQRRYQDITLDDVWRLLQSGSARAREEAGHTMREVRMALGLTLDP